MMLILLLVFMLSVITPSSSEAGQDVCFTREEAGRILVDLERAQSLKELNAVLEEVNENLVVQNKLLKERADLIEQKHQDCEDMRDIEKTTCEEQLRQERKFPWGWTTGSFLTGALAVVAVLILL